jgi:N-acetylmuramoyl-L-alanine amidase
VKFRTVFIVVLLIEIFFISFPSSVYSFIERALSSNLIGRFEEAHLLKLKIPVKSSHDHARVLREYAVPGTEIDVISYEKEGTQLYFHIPYKDLLPEYQRQLIQLFFPQDRPTSLGWVHVVTYFDRREGKENLWRIALWFTGKGSNYGKIEEHNTIDHRYMYRGQHITIPNSLLMSHFRMEQKSGTGSDQLLIPTPVQRASPTPVLATPHPDSQLEFKSDKHGEYAAYYLKRGEALYSAVVIRYTGRIGNEDVLEASEIIRRRSNIRDVTDIPVGFEIKIPMDLLSVEYLPLDDPRRQYYEEIRQEAKQFVNPVRSKDLSGVYLILDAGHGGNDTGAMGSHGVSEDEYVYDIMCRIKRIVELETHGKVCPTIIDRRTKYAVKNYSTIPIDRNEVLLTTPPYYNVDSRISVNLRCYLTNYIYRKLVKSGVHPDKIVFASIHADALHPSTWGTMVYIPGFEYTKSEFSVRGKAYNKFQEYKSQRKIRFSRRDRLKSEGYSREFGKILLQTLRRESIPLHPDKPMREYVYRKRAKWLPAIIRYNQVTTKILVEVVNLKNRKDVKRIRDEDFREKFARSFVKAVVEYYNKKKD